MEKHTDRILELKSIYYSYHNADGETPAITDLSFAVNESSIAPSFRLQTTSRMTI